MKTRQGFVGAGVLMAIILGLIIVGSGVYYFTQRSSPSLVLSENNSDALPIPTQTVPTTFNSVSTQTNQNISTANSQSGWENVSVSGIVVEYPPYLKVIANESVPVAHLELEQKSGGHAYVSVSAANIISANQELKSWLESYDYFNYKYRSQKYESYKREDGVEVIASFSNTQPYDDAFIRVGTVIVYIKNGINDVTKAKDSDFREIIQRIKLPDIIKVGAVANSGPDCLIDSDDLMTLYWGTQYLRANPTIPFIYDPGSYCELSDGSKLMTVALITEKAIVMFNKDGKIVNTYKDNFCHTMGDFSAPLILSIEQGNLNLFCLTGDGPEREFNVYQAPLTTLVPTEVKRDTEVYNTIKSAVKKLYNINIDF